MDDDWGYPYFRRPPFSLLCFAAWTLAAVPQAKWPWLMSEKYAEKVRHNAERSAPRANVEMASDPSWVWVENMESPTFHPKI